jgi:hypothetical protein
VYLNGGRGISDLFEAMCMSTQKLEKAIRKELFPLLYGEEEAEYPAIEINMLATDERTTATLCLESKRVIISSMPTDLQSNEQEFKLFVQDQGAASDADEDISFDTLSLLFARVFRVLSYSSE